MKNKTFKKVLVTALATVMMATSISPATVEAAKKDTKKPTVQVKMAGTSKYKTLKSVSGYRKPIRIKVSDKSGIKKVTVQRDIINKTITKTYKKGTIVLTKTGRYTITVIDNNGNKKVIKRVFIDKMKPTIEVIDRTAQQAGVYVIDVLDWSGKSSGSGEIDYIRINNGKKIKIDGHQWVCGIEFPKGTHTIVACDEAGNKTTKTFTIN